MSDVRHEYVVLAVGGEWAEKVTVGQYLYTKKYEGKERDWNFVNIRTMCPTGYITGLHRRKVTLEQLKAESENTQTFIERSGDGEIRVDRVL